MTFQKLVLAAPALGRMRDKELPLTAAYTLHQMLKLLQEEIDFYNLRKDEISRKYGGVPDVETSLINFPSPEAQEKAQQEFEDLNSLEISTKLIPIVLSVFGNQQISVSPSDIGLLEEFFTFIE